MVQSAIARWVLNQHLIHLGITSAEESGMHDDLDIAFNVLWADNGDAISREYAGTSALKGDFTRTGKRDWRGAMNEYVYRATVALDHPVNLCFPGRPAPDFRVQREQLDRPHPAVDRDRLFQTSRARLPTRGQLERVPGVCRAARDVRPGRDCPRRCDPPRGARDGLERGPRRRRNQSRSVEPAVAFRDRRRAAAEGRQVRGEGPLALAKGDLRRQLRLYSAEGKFHPCLRCGPDEFERES